MTASATDLTEEGRVFLQRRVALFAKVMVVTQLLGMLGLILQSPWDHLWHPWFALYQVQTAVPLVAWLVCRQGQRSPHLVSGMDAMMILGTAPTRGRISRLVGPGVRGIEIGEAVRPGDGSYGLVVGMVQGAIMSSFVIGLSLWAFTRAAIVPSRPLRTAMLTGLMAVPMVAVHLVETLPFEPTPSLRSLVAPERVVGNVGDTLIWWAFITGVCTIVSVVIFGLRRQVRQARQLGQYTLERKLGEGGMGAVYRASHALMRRPTAIKLVRPDKAGETSLARFEREVRLTARLTHPNTVTIFDYGRTPDGLFYYAMELLDGATLDEIVGLAGPMSPGRVVKVLAELAGALEEAHGIDLIHRDIKPSNVILCTQGGKPDVAKLLDFGLVKELGGQDDVELTKDSALTGTPQYLCPESLTAPDAVDGRGDLYALGAVGYFLLTGQPVFEGATMVEVCGHHLHSEPVPPGERLGEPVPDDLEALILACLEKAPGDRPSSAAELGSRLAACQSMGEWTEAEARRWWTAHGDSLRANSAEDATRSETRTIAVDLARKGGSSV